MLSLKVNNLVKTYNLKDKELETQALKSVDLEINEGEFTAIMGPSGSGKTTLLNIISGIDKADSGKVEIGKKNILSMNRNDLALFRRKHIGIVFQDYNLIDSLSIKENIMVPMIMEEQELSYMEEKIGRLTKFLGINNILEKNPYEISGGQKQRAAICRAVMNNPDIIVADEPTGNLDSKSTKDVMKYFEKINKEFNNTILMVTHDSFAASYCNRVVFLKDGNIVSEIRKSTDRKEFFEDILKELAVIGGDNSDV